MKTLLFVDDEPKVLQGLQRQLRPLRHEWEMNFVEDGQKALEFMAMQPVDIIVSDMMMPRMDGSQLLCAFYVLNLKLVAFFSIETSSHLNFMNKPHDQTPSTHTIPITPPKEQWKMM